MNRHDIKLIKIIILLLSLFVSVAFNAPGDKPTLAVLDLDGEGVSKSDARIITGFIEEIIFNTSNYKMVSRTQIDKLVKELEYQQSGLCGLECAVNLGRQLAANKVVFGTVGRLGTNYSIQIKLVDVESGVIEKIKSIQAQDEIEKLPAYVDNLVKDLFGIEQTDSSLASSIIDYTTFVQVLMRTSMGNITIELYPAKAPITVKNFLSYVKDKFYVGTIFHRVIRNFMIQGGGMTANFFEKPAKSPIRNEAGNGLKNLRGTIAMARTSDVGSATCQFFINLKDNRFLDYKESTAEGFGYCVFGNVIAGMDVVDAIANVPTGTRGAYENVPHLPIIIQSVEIISRK